MIDFDELNPAFQDLGAYIEEEQEEYDYYLDEEHEYLNDEDYRYDSYDYLNDY